MTIKDPEGTISSSCNTCRVLSHSRDFGKDLPDTRVSAAHHPCRLHGARPRRGGRLLQDILGFRDIWHGGMKDDRTDWVDMRVPDGTDWLEYMLNVHNPSPRTLGVMNHLALGVPDINAGYDTVVARDLKCDKPQIGRDGKWQLNLYDPNLTRAELMEPKPVRDPVLLADSERVAQLIYIPPLI